MKTEKWKDAKNAIDRKENSRTRIKEGRGFENWKKVFDVLDKIFGGFLFFQPGKLRAVIIIQHMFIDGKFPRGLHLLGLFR